MMSLRSKNFSFRDARFLFKEKEITYIFLEMIHVPSIGTVIMER